MRGSAGLRAPGTCPGHHQVDLLGIETVPGIEVSADLFDQVSLVVIHLPTNLAYEVEVVVRMAQLPPCPFIRTQTRLADQIQVGKQGKSAIDGRGVDRRVGLVHLPHDLFDRQMASGSIQHLPDSKPGLRETIAPVPEQFG